MMMSRKIKKGNSWTKLIIVLSLLCSVFSVGVNAQTDSDKPLNAPQLANLKTGLKQVVQENLAVAETDGKKYAAITKKWDARKDLAGKSKTQVIDLLFQDVKTVVADSGMQYQISSVFSFYKQMPDEQFSGKKDSKQMNSSKKEAVEKLTELTLPSHPWVVVPKPWAAKTEDEAARQRQVKKLDDALALNKELTVNQKLFVKAHYDELRETVSKQVAEVAEAMFPFEQWAEENLEQRFTEKLTAPEVNRLIAYFQGNAGQKSLKVLKNAGPSQELVKNGGKPLFTKEEEAEAQKFSETAVGKKFMEAFLGDAKEDLEARIEEAGKSDGNKARAITEPANLNKIFNRFVAENYKK